MGISTVAVAIGILGEYVAHFIFEKEARRNRLEMAISIIFGVFVLGGVVGEYIFGSKLSEVAGQLQRMADTEVAQSNKDAAAARKEAGSFELDIAKANKGAADALERAARAEESLGQARRDAALAEQHAADANRIAEQERLERVKIEEKLADRHLTPTQRDAVTAKLRPFPKQIVNLVAYPSSGDAPGVANELIAVLQKAGWEVHAFMGQEAGRTIRGILVEFTPQAEETTKQAASALVLALRSQRIAVKAVPMLGTSGLVGSGELSPNATMHITVGNKP